MAGGSGFSKKTGKKYGFISASDLNIGKGGLGANMRGGSLRGPMHRVGYIRSPSPGFSGAGMEHYGAMIPSAIAINRKLTSGIEKMQQRYATNPDEEAAASGPMESHLDPPAWGGAPAARQQPEFGYAALPDLDANRPPSPLERQQQADDGPIVLPGKLGQFAASRTGRFMEGALEKGVDLRFGRGAYSSATGRGSRVQRGVVNPNPAAPF